MNVVDDGRRLPYPAKTNPSKRQSASAFLTLWAGRGRLQGLSERTEDFPMRVNQKFAGLESESVELGSHSASDKHGFFTELEFGGAVRWVGLYKSRGCQLPFETRSSETRYKSSGLIPPGPTLHIACSGAIGTSSICCEGGQPPLYQSEYLRLPL